MKCEKAQELFSDHLEGLLERPMAVAFDQHIAECSSCTHEYEAFKTTWQMLQTLPEVAPPPGFSWDVVMKVRMQREAERRATPKWKLVWNSLFTAKVPRFAFGTAVAAVLAFQIVVRTPIKDAIIAGLGGIPKPAAQITASAPTVDKTKQVSEAWQHSGLKFELGASGVMDGTNYFQLMLRPQGAARQHVRVYALNPSSIRFDDQGLKSSGPVLFDGVVDQSGQVVSSIWRYDDPQAVMSMLVEWNHMGRKFTEAIFVPTELTPQQTPGINTLALQREDIYSSLRSISSTFGVVILANADIDAKAGAVNVKNGTADDALYQALSDIGLVWRSMGPQVYSVERKID